MGNFVRVSHLAQRLSGMPVMRGSGAHADERSTSRTRYVSTDDCNLALSIRFAPWCLAGSRVEGLMPSGCGWQ